MEYTVKMHSNEKTWFFNFFETPNSKLKLELVTLHSRFEGGISDLFPLLTISRHFLDRWV